ncbi:hypothetical protein HOB94_00485 [bacterium]|nr:hypothetical protein [bacterium]MBT4632499.1 hypothetical protein [bacterium]
MFISKFIFLINSSSFSGFASVFIFAKNVALTGGHGGSSNNFTSKSGYLLNIYSLKIGLI